MVLKRFRCQNRAFRIKKVNRANIKRIRFKTNPLPIRLTPSEYKVFNSIKPSFKTRKQISTETGIEQNVVDRIIKKLYANFLLEKDDEPKPFKDRRVSYVKFRVVPPYR